MEEYVQGDYMHLDSTEVAAPAPAPPPNAARAKRSNNAWINHFSISLSGLDLATNGYDEATQGGMAAGAAGAGGNSSGPPTTTPAAPPPTRPATATMYQPMLRQPVDLELNIRQPCVEEWLQPADMVYVGKISTIDVVMARCQWVTLMKVVFDNVLSPPPSS